MRFTYLEVSRGVFAPIINLEIWTGGRWVVCEAYIDSGATYSIFHTDVAELLGLSYRKGRRMFVKVGDGGLISVYLHRLPVRFADIKFNAPIGFSESLGVGFNLLGRVGFFDRFRICFDDKNRVVETTQL